jgi:methylmalonyl-CoA mutase cobalamin-binding subunit
MLTRDAIFPGAPLPDAGDLLDHGRRLALDWRVGPCAFLQHHGVTCEADFKRAAMARGELMFHAQVGFRDPARTLAAWVGIHEAMARRGQQVHRYGLCLDWSMGFTREQRARRGVVGTGLVLEDAAALAELTAAAPVAPHLGDFVLGFPAALENTQAALAAGATSIGNLGQFFTFRLPGHDDDVESATATLAALALIAAQPQQVLVHSNLDDGFAALFTDLSCTLGTVLLEQHLVETLLGASVSHCYGHHFSDARTRLAFQQALAELSNAPGTMVYGNTLAYRDSPAANYATLAFYLGVDIHGQRSRPSGHAINAVPVSENERIPDIDEIIDAQCFAQRMAQHMDEDEPLLDAASVAPLAGELARGARVFHDNVLAGLAGMGVDCANPLEFMLAIKRLGPRRLEQLFAPGAEDDDQPRGHHVLVPSPPFKAIRRESRRLLQSLTPEQHATIGRAQLRACVASTDVHEHGVMLLCEVLRGLGVQIVDAGVSIDADRLATLAAEGEADLLALGTYNGIALSYARALQEQLCQRDLTVPVYLGGRLNQIPDGSNTSLPRDVSGDLDDLGMHPCQDLPEFLQRLFELARQRVTP